MERIEDIIRNTTEENQTRTDWTRAWSTRYPVLKSYQSMVDVQSYASEIRRLLWKLGNDYGYSEEDAMLVLKDILAHEYLDNRKKTK